MSAINTLRGILVAGAALAAVVAAVAGRWSTVVILGLALAAHGLLWVRLHRPVGPRAAPASPEG